MHRKKLGSDRGPSMQEISRKWRHLHNGKHNDIMHNGKVGCKPSHKEWLLCNLLRYVFSVWHGINGDTYRIRLHGFYWIRILSSNADSISTRR